MLLVVAVIAILASVGVPYYIGALEEAKCLAVKTDLQEISRDINNYFVIVGSFPETLAEANVKKLTDPWGNPYQYSQPGTNNPSGFDLWSHGADGAAGGEGYNGDIGNWEKEQ